MFIIWLHFIASPKWTLRFVHVTLKCVFRYSLIVKQFGCLKMDSENENIEIRIEIEEGVENEQNMQIQIEIEEDDSDDTEITTQSTLTSEELVQISQADTESVDDNESDDETEFDYYEFSEDENSDDAYLNMDPILIEIDCFCCPKCIKKVFLEN